MSEIAVTGSGSVLAVGDAMLPEHGLGIANGYDDCYHLTPARVVRQIVALGYRGDIVHYVGMSHYMRLAAEGGGFYASLARRGDQRALRGVARGFRARMRGGRAGSDLVAVVRSFRRILSG